MKRKILLSIIYIIILMIFGFVLILLGRAAVYKYYPLKYDEYIKQCCYEYGLDINLVRAVIYTESRYDKSAISPKGAMGLMQITPDTKDWICEKYNIEIPDDTLLFDPKTNISIGCLILNSHFEEFNNTETVLAAYNAGRGVVNEWLKDSNDGNTLNSIPYSETENYVNKVIRLTETYKKLYDKEN